MKSQSTAENLLFTDDEHLPNNSAYSARNSVKPVSFFYNAPGAKIVQITGDFNHWHPSPMRRSVDGWWFAQLQICHGHHQYRFLVDGKPVLDPHATGTTRDANNDRVSIIAVG